MITKKNLSILFSLIVGLFINVYAMQPSLVASSAAAPIDQVILSQKELKLHFDVNRTIIAIDSIVAMGLEAMIDEIMVDFTFAKWNGVDMQSYRAYITDQVAQENSTLARTDRDFESKRSDRLKGFAEDLKKHPALLAQCEQEKAQMLAILGGTEPVIFPSFYKAIQWLERHYPGKYTIYLRTFGQDLPVVVPMIEKNTPLKFVARGEFRGTDLHMTVLSGSLLGFMADLGPKHYAIRDDYAYWESKGFQAIGGKQFPIDLENTSVVSMFFDDYADDKEEPTINPVGPNGKIENTEQLLRLGNIVAVDPKKAILDEDYFINKIKALLTN